MERLKNHPGYIAASKRLVSRLTSHHFHFRHLKPLIFLCGGRKSNARDTLVRALRKRRPDYYYFFAETVWEHIPELEGLNSLKMETQLALLADALVILVESPGSIAELGAFSAIDSLREKIMPIVPMKYKGEDSFISTGPIRWVDAESRFKPTLYCDPETILLSLPEIETRLDLIPKTGQLPKAAAQAELAQNPKQLLLLIGDIISIIGPASPDQCSAILTGVIGGEPSFSTTSLIGLLVAIHLIEERTFKGEKLYVREQLEGELPSFQVQRVRSLAEERAHFWSGLIKIGVARELLGAFLLRGVRT
jgi:hypothetical protein